MILLLLNCIKLNIKHSKFLYNLKLKHHFNLNKLLNLQYENHLFYFLIKLFKKKIYFEYHSINHLISFFISLLFC